MGFIFYGQVILGFLVDARSASLAATRDLECSRGHPLENPGWNFCPRCGEPIATRLPVNLREITAILDSETAGFHPVDALRPNRDSESMWAFGYRVLDAAHYEDREVKSVDPSDLPEKIALLEECRKLLGYEERPIQLFLSLYHSL